MRSDHALLHNMSAPPKSVVKYEGLSGLVNKPLPGGSGLTSVKFKGVQQFGQPIRFALPESVQGLSAADLLAWLGEGHHRMDGPTADRRLRALIDQRAAELPLPEGCAVIKAEPDHPVLWSDALAALAVLSKCTETVWLRGKTPALAAAVQRDAVSLLIPPAFVHQIKDLKR